MISNQLTTIKGLSNKELTKVDSGKFQTEKCSNDTQQFPSIPKLVSMNTDMKCDDNITSVVSTTTDNICQIDLDQSTHVSYHLFSQSKTNLNEYNSKLILTKQNLSHSKISDYIDWTNHPSNSSSIETTINNQLDAIHFLQEYLKNGNNDVLIDLLYEIAQEINLDQHKNHYSYSAMNNNHLHLLNSNFQFSNNKEKKNKKEKFVDKEKKEDKKKEDADNEMTSTKTKKSKEKVKKIEETTTTTTTTDSDVVLNSPSLINSTHINLNNPKSPSIGFPSLSIPVPHSGVSSINGLISPDPSRIHIPQPSDSKFAHLSQVQDQLQTDLQNPSLNKTTYPHNMSIQQQLQSLSQMARDGDEILITLSINALTQKQQINNNSTNNTQYNQSSFQNNPYSSQSWNQMIPTSTGIMMPRNLEIVAKGFARIQNEHPQPSSSNPYPQQQQQSTMSSYNQLPFTLVPPPFAPRYPMPCYSNSGCPPTPIGPPIQPIFTSPNMRMSGGFIRPPNSAEFTRVIRNNIDDSRNRSHKNTEKCDYLCQSSLYQPDFRGRPSPDITINPYISNPPPLPMNFSAKRSSKHKTKSNRLHNINTENMNRNYSSIY